MLASKKVKCREGCDFGGGGFNDVISYSQASPSVCRGTSANDKRSTLPSTCANVVI